MFRSLLIVSTLLILTACGGGGGTPTSVKVDSGATGVGWNIQTQVQIIDGSLGILQNNSISAMKNVSNTILYGILNNRRFE